MQKKLLPEAEQYAKQNNRRRIWRNFVRVMACIVVFCTTYALILPAITMEREPRCGLEEHIHTGKCYTQKTAEQVKKLACTYESLDVHVHDEQECYGEDKTLICGYADFLIHEHDASCVDEWGSLVCQLPEVKEHEHTQAECYRAVEMEPVSEVAEEVHENDDSSYTIASGELTCQIAEAKGHSHTQECYEAYLDENEVEQTKLICQETVVLEHTHSDSCYVVEEIPVDTETLTCGKEETEGHSHAEECYDENGELVCGLEEIEAHAHTDRCHGTWEMTCGYTVEHTHTLECYADKTADLETEATWTAGLPETTGTWRDDLLAIAKSQLGYKESEKNYIVEADGETLSGYNRYGAWYASVSGDDSYAYAPWNVTFLFFDLYHAGIDVGDFPYEEDCVSWIDSLSASELYRAAGEYAPNPGDLIFVDTDSDGEADRAGLVSEVLEDTVTVIEGDYDGAVTQVTYTLPALTAAEETAETTEAAEVTEINLNTSFTSIQLLSDGQDAETETTEAADKTETVEAAVVGYADMLQAQLATVQVEETAPTVLASYELTPGYDYFYLDVSSFTWYFDDGVDVRLWYWNNGGSGKYSEKFTQYSGNIYWLKVPSDMDVDNANIILQRFDPNKVSTGQTTFENTCYEKSADITVRTDLNTFKLTASNGGNWSTWTGQDYSSGSSGGGGTGGTTGTVVDIKTEKFVRDSDALYVDSTFYDYYTDYEYGSSGKNRDTNTSWGGDKFESFGNWYVFNNFNTALGSYYSGVSEKIPIYIGHFQPDWTTNNERWGYQFKDSDLGKSNLYGFMDNEGKEVYYTTGTDQKYFMSVNNSYMASDSTPSSDLTNYAAQGLVGSTLGSEGPLTKSSGVTLPFFSEEFLAGDNSLQTKLGDVYGTVSFPFTKKDIKNNGVEYWVFDSLDTTLEMKQDSETGVYFLDEVDANERHRYKNLDSGSNYKTDDYGNPVYGFFPFNSGSSENNANTYNYGFGCRLDITFGLTEDGYVLDKDGNKVPITYEFSGDDDVWVFIDGLLVLDIGGAHGRVTGDINFGTGIASVDNAKINPGTGNKDIYGNESYNGPTTYNFKEDFKNTYDIEFDYNSEHTLTMFYMERGMWESNMKITFNFPDENQLEVEKQVNTNAVNNSFKSLFDNEKIFAFNIKTLATHFGEKDVVTGGKKTISLSAADYEAEEPNEGVPFTEDGNGVLHWYTDLNDSESDDRDIRYGQIKLNDPVDLSEYETFNFTFYYDHDDTPGLQYFFIDFLDASGNSLLKDDYMSLSSCISGTVNMGGKRDISVSLDLDKMFSGTNRTVQYIKLGYDWGRNIYFKNMYFKPELEVVSTKSGFVTAQKDIPDYGSASSGVLEIPKYAEYTSSDGGSYLIGSDGKFYLHDDESVIFYDQFRRGSYIYLQEESNPLYTTTWSMYEGEYDDPVYDSAIPDDATTVQLNSKGSKSMWEYDGNTVTDNRVEKARAADDAADVNKYRNEADYIYDNGEGSIPADAFVFRHYTNPDSTSTTTKLKVVFTNTIQVGSLTIKKTQGENSEALGNEDFQFYVEFYNVGGMYLEDSPIIVPITLTKDQSQTITGIPVGTWFKIHEVKKSESTDGSRYVLNNVIMAMKNADETYDYQDISRAPVEDTVTVNGDEINTYSTDGWIASAGSTAEYEMENIKNSYVSLTVNKTWAPSEENATPPYIIYVQLQSSTDGQTWTAVKGYENVELDTEGEAWTEYSYTFKDLPRYVDPTASTLTEYKYQVVELNGDGSALTNNKVTLNGKEYTVTYSNLTNEGTAYTQTITNTQQSAPSLQITKLSTETDNDGKNIVLGGIEFKLTQKNENGEEVTIATRVTGDDGIAKFENLAAGTYELVEVLTEDQAKLYAPAGPWTITVTESNGTFTIAGGDGLTVSSTNDKLLYTTTIYNTPWGYELPDTGGAGTYLYTLGGIVLMALPLLYGYNQWRKRERRAAR